MEGVYRFAEKKVLVRSLHAAVHDYCADWRTEEAPDFTVEITPEILERERGRAAASDAALGRPVHRWPEGYLEELAVYRAVCERLPFYDTILLHGSALCADGEGYLFTAPSGTGKSTHARLWREAFGERVVMINDDKPLLLVRPEGVKVYGTPFRGKHGLGGDRSAPLRAIAVLSRGTDNAIRPLSAGDAMGALLRQVYRPADREAMAATLTLLQTLCRTVRFYALSCNMDPSAARVAFEGMKG